MSIIHRDTFTFIPDTDTDTDIIELCAASIVLSGLVTRLYPRTGETDRCML